MERDEQLINMLYNDIVTAEEMSVDIVSLSKENTIELYDLIARLTNRRSWADQGGTYE